MHQDKNGKLLVVISSFPRLEDAQLVARHLIEHHLAACVQIQEGVHSFYRWEGKICEESEVLLSAKTDASLWPAICEYIKDKHPYDLPEILAFTPEQYEEHYGKWVQAEVK